MVVESWLQLRWICKQYNNDGCGISQIQDYGLCVKIIVWKSFKCFLAKVCWSGFKEIKNALWTYNGHYKTVKYDDYESQIYE